jgi:CubicO group peptidase (beta-lactamase class C family)
MFRKQASVKTAQALKMLVLLPDTGEVSPATQMQLIELETLDRCELVVHYHRVSVTNPDKQSDACELSLASMIDDNKFDMVLVDEKVQASSWAIHAFTKTNPIFYLCGEADKIIQKEVDRSDFSGAYRLDIAGQVLISSAAKQANQASAILNDPAIRYNIGSIGKLFTSIAIAKLVAENKLEYHIPIAQSFEKIKNSNPEYAKRIVAYEAEFNDYFQFTPHALLTHTAGLDDNIAKLFEDSHGAKMLNFNSVADYICDCAALDKQVYRTKGSHQYSNFGYFILGLAIEAITGDYYAFVQENIFQPCGMTDTVAAKILEFNTNMCFEAALVDENVDVAMRSLASVCQTWFYHQQARYPLIEQIVNDFQCQIGTIESSDWQVFKESYSHHVTIALESISEYPHAMNAIKELNEPFHTRVMAMDKSDTNYQSMLALDEMAYQLFCSLNTQLHAIMGILNDLSIAHPAGCWRSTLADMMMFDRYLQENDHFKKLTDMAIVIGPDTRYGYGCVMRGQDDHTRCFGHGGDAPGAHATYNAYPNHGYTVITLTNDDENGHRMAEALEKNLIFAADIGIKYLDSRINQDTKLLLLQDIGKLQEAVSLQMRPL